MKGLLYLAFCHAKRERLQTAILIACATVSFALPLCTSLLFERYDQNLRARAATSPLLLGVKGNDLDLTLTSLYFRKADIETLPRALWDELGLMRMGLAIPLHLKFTARNRPIVGTSPEYFDHRGLKPANGSAPLLLGEVALGSAVAAEWGKQPGDFVFSDPLDLYDLTKPSALKLKVVGVFQETGTADDQALFVGIRTAWVLEGAFHGHDEAKEVPAEQILGREANNLRLSGALIEYNEITPENIDSFHFHGDPTTLPLTSVLFVPNSDKDRTIVRGRFETRAGLTMLRPAQVIDDLMRNILKIKELLDGLSALAALTTIALTGLVIGLGLRLRRRELKTFHHLGASKGFVFALVTTEIAGILGAAFSLALLITFAILRFLPDLVRFL